MENFLLYSPTRKWKRGDLPFSPYVAVALGSHSKVESEIILTPQLMTDSEIDYEVDRLIKELEELKVLAKKELAILRKKRTGRER